MSQPLDNYFEALGRLKKNRPSIVPKGTKISNDAVALEAGRGKGSIKKSRLIFADLITAIDKAAKEQFRPNNELKESLGKAKMTADEFRRLWEEAIVREISLLHELYELKKRLAKLTGAGVLPLRPK